MSTPIHLRTEDGLALEARVDEPPTAGAGLVFCHPHPQMGGTMNAPLLEAVTGYLVERGWAVLRFNFRGIGGSEGVTGTGIEELKDARAAIAEARERWGSLPLAVAGWSFGAAVAVKVAGATPGLLACVAIAPAVAAKPGITAGLPPPREVGSLPPTLFIVGANDATTPPEAAAAWAEEAGVAVSIVPAANHLFWGRYPQLAAIIGDFLARRSNEEE